LTGFEGPGEEGAIHGAGNQTMSDAAFLLGLIGEGIQASRTPAMHEREAAAQQMRVIYRLIDMQRLGLGVESLADLLLCAERMGFNGLNITHPCKQAVVPLLDELSPEARALNAVNTVLLSDGRRTGHNTDWSGFADSFRRSMPDANRDRVVQLGAGGAGSAVAYAAMMLGVQQLTIIDIDVGRAATVAEGLRMRFADRRIVANGDLRDAVAEADGLINTTPMGMASHPGLPLPAALLRPQLWVAEIVYFPLQTALLKQARAVGCRTLDGSGMAVFQAAAAFRLFTGREPDVDRMLRHFRDMG
jgi:shikimate dehydrogenase